MDLKVKGKTVIGLTGPIASGKSLALELFRGEGALCLSADEVSASLLTEPACYRKILRKFSPGTILTNGRLDKKKLAAEVFGSPAKRKWLEALLHPRILGRLRALIRKSPKKLAVVEAPLLFEAGLADSFTLTVCLAAPEKILRRRALERGWSGKDYGGRAAAQLKAEEKYALADIVLENAGAKRELQKQVRFICRFLKETAQGKSK